MDQTSQTTQPANSQTPTPPAPSPTPMDNLPKSAYPPPRHVPKAAVVCIFLLILAAIILGGFNIYKYFFTPILVSAENLRATCEEKEGRWLDDYKECATSLNDKGLDEASCASLGGRFNPCESACRHDTTNEDCPAVCVKVCKF